MNGITKNEANVAIGASASSRPNRRAAANANENTLHNHIIAEINRIREMEDSANVVNSDCFELQLICIKHIALNIRNNVSVI